MYNLLMIQLDTLQGPQVLNSWSNIGAKLARH